MQVDFYILSKQPLLSLLVKLAEKILAQQLSAYVRTANSTQSASLCTQLWTYRDISFLPHCLSTAAEADLTPLVIGDDSQPSPLKAILINVSLEMPQTIAGFVRVIEIVDNTETAKQAGRARYRAYQGMDGVILHTHQV